LNNILKHDHKRQMNFPMRYLNIIHYMLKPRTLIIIWVMKIIGRRQFLRIRIMM